MARLRNPSLNPQWIGRIAAVVCLAGASSLGCGAPDETTEQAGSFATVCGRGGTVEGIDISSYQATINWPMVRAAGKRFAIARIGDGTYRDRYFATNWAAIRAQGMIRGAYLYFEPNTDVDTQAMIVIAAVGRLGPGDLPVTLDVEKPGPGLPSPATYTARIQRFVTLVTAGTGKRPMIYTGRYYWQDYVRSTAFAGDPLWHAQYTSAACPNIADQWRDWAFWQYTSSGRVAGIAGNVDLDRFNGSLTQLQALAGMNTVMDSGVRPDVAPPVDVPSRPDVTASDVRTDVPTRTDVVSDGGARADAAEDLGATTDAAANDVAQADVSTPDVPTPDVEFPDVVIDDAGLDDDGGGTMGGAGMDPDGGGTAGAGGAMGDAGDEGGCGCRAAGSHSRGTQTVFALGVLAITAGVRRRRR